jgi:hypothetical protein
LLSAAATSVIAALRCTGVISFKLIPPRGINPVGKFDHRARCASSLNANTAVCRCLALSAARKASAALTIRAVPVCAGAAITARLNTNATAHRQIACKEKTPIRSPHQPSIAGLLKVKKSGPGKTFP